MILREHCAHGDLVHTCRRGCYERAEAATRAATPVLGVILTVVVLGWLFVRADDAQHAMSMERARPQIEHLREVLTSPTATSLSPLPSR
ncbi:MAG: hypothetical protein AB7P99_10535 [Vicinamibacterales bacterium]